MFRDVQRTTELGPDTSEILEPEDRAAIEELSVALQVKDIDDLNSKSLIRRDKQGLLVEFFYFYFEFWLDRASSV